jgi:hypothetical protein
VSIDATPAFELPQHALYLDWEAAVSAGNGNWELATIDIIAMLNIAQQLDDVPGSLFLLESYKIGRHAMERVLICMMHQSSGFSIDQLARLEERIKKYKLQKFRADFAGNAWVFDDMLQQMFVVTESGDGYLHLPSYDDPRDSMKGWEVLVAPWVAKQKYCSLSEIKQQHSRLMQIANREFSQPAWKLGRSKLVATVMELAENEKLTVLTEIFPDLTTSYIVSEQAHETADVVLIIIAARRYAIEHGNWPTDLHDLVPSYLERIPRNRFDGKQYCSNLKDGLLTVYSFGFDGDDDRGRVRLLEDSEDESDAPGHVKPRVYRLGRKPYRAERNVIASDWQNRIQNGHVVEYDRDIVHFQELPPIPDSQTKESKDRNKDDAPGAAR